MLSVSGLKFTPPKDRGSVCPSRDALVPFLLGDIKEPPTRQDENVTGIVASEEAVNWPVNIWTENTRPRTRRLEKSFSRTP